MKTNDVYLQVSSKRFLFAMALAAGCSLLPQMTKAKTAIQAVQQVGGVTGQATDKNGATIIGATVKVVGTQNATVTDLD